MSPSSRTEFGFAYRLAVGSAFVQNAKCVSAIPLISGFFAESGWFTAYPTGAFGRYGEELGGMGSVWFA
jgi:hypothetical protein